MAPTATESLPVEIGSEDETWEDAEEEVNHIKCDNTISLSLEEIAKEDLGEDETVSLENKIKAKVFRSVEISE